MKKKEPAPVFQEVEKPEKELEFKVRVYLGETRQRVQEKVKKDKSRCCGTNSQDYWFSAGKSCYSNK